MSPRADPILILYNMPPEDGSGHLLWRESNAGVLEEVKAVSSALTNLGTPYRVKGISRFRDLPQVLEASSERIVFNLIEDLRDQPVYASYVPSMCAAFEKISTGSDTPCLLLSLDKWKTKKLLQAAGVPCPAGAVVPPGKTADEGSLPPGTLIVKPVASDASEGINARSVVKAGDKDALREAVRMVHEQFGNPALIEQFVGGREFNVSLLEKEGNVQVLPVAEIDFSAFDGNRPRIVDYAAKWLPDSFEFKNTPRVIPAPLKPDMAERIRAAAITSWQVLGCTDYARVDMRLDDAELPIVLEVNSNPDISPGAGFAAAMTAANISYEQFITAIIRNARRRLSERLIISQPIHADQPPPKIHIRRTESRDREAILALLTATGFFRPNELEIAQEVLDEALEKGADGHYQSFTADEGGEAVGWVCFGPTPCTVGSFDIYWVGVAPGKQRLRMGSVLMHHAESLIKERGGRLIVVETSGRPTYDATRRFYERLGYRESARIGDFYAPGDDKVIYTKTF